MVFLVRDARTVCAFAEGKAGGSCDRTLRRVLSFFSLFLSASTARDRAMIHRRSRFSLRLAAAKTGSVANPINASRRLGKSPELLVSVAKRRNIIFLRAPARFTNANFDDPLEFNFFN